MENILTKKNLIISGPCSAETEDQLWKTANELSKLGNVDVFRAGIWKPRTRPNSFEGVGEIGLQWLLDIKKETGLKTAVEVATIKQLELAQKYQVDVVWIGARTTINPFYVTELATCLKDSSQMVLIKNPINPDLNAWIGAVERFQNEGVNNLGIIHRGFSVFKDTTYRNVPIWDIAKQMKAHFPSVPLICDPSHICGNRNNLLSVSQKSIDLGFDGLMIETHYNPDLALTDSIQQLTPQNFNNLLNQLNWQSLTNTSSEDEIKLLRKQIDGIDENILSHIALRLNLAREIGELKDKRDMSVLQSNRWEEVQTNNLIIGKNLKLNADFVKKYIETIHSESIRIQYLSKNEK